MRYIASFLLFFLVACTKGPTTPEGLLKMYVEDITTKTLDKDYFESYTTDELLARVTELNEEDFKEYINLKRVKNPKIEILNKNCTGETQCSLTYILKYDMTGKDNKTFKSEIKKVAIIKSIEGNWKISDVSNIKTFIDSTTPIEVLK